MIRYYLRNPEWSLERKTDGASGYDLRADLHVDGDKAIVTDGVDIGLVARLNSIIIPPGGRVTIKTGLHLEMPIGVEAQVRSRSGLASKHGIVVVMGVGTVDSDYRGDVSVSLVNLDWQNGYEIKHGDRIAQLVFGSVLLGLTEDKKLPPPLFTPRATNLERVADVDDLSTTERGASGHGSTGR
jgi:dUTP pyrophosphatase